ncbi:MAG: Protease 3 precursor [Deltaproteobacteria bacterium ADurb.Bin510]|nr:MAG: Protease 3 precursor [Deltaproteobacteria bacterium ADurb.Bin510]
MRQATVLDNGVRIVTEAMASVRSVSLGIWVNTGARQDTISGIAHFTEHMLFKGTQRRSALQISKEIDALGGILNASTSKEYTVYYVKVLDEHLPKAADVLFDLFLNSTIDEGELAKEKDVILQEIHMTEDTPDDYINDLFAESVFRGSSLSRPILGSHDSVSSITASDIRDFMAEFYDPVSIVIVAAGSVDHQRLVELARTHFDGLKLRPRPLTEPASLALGERKLYYKDLEQVQITLGVKGPAMHDERRWAYLVLNNLLGGSMSSMLFQEVREKLGLVYSVYSYLSAYRDCGALTIYAGTTPKNVGKAIEVCCNQFKRLKAGDFGDLSLDDVKEQIKGSLMLSREGTESRMSANAKNELYFHREVPIEEIIARVQGVTNDELIALAAEIFRPEALSLVTLGKLGESQLDLTPLKL